MRMFFKSHTARFATIAVLKRHIRIYKKAFLILTGLCAFVLSHAQELEISFRNEAGKEVLETGKSYTNAFGEIFTVRNFRYYISNIVLFDSIHNRSQSFPDDYFLIDEKIEASKKIVLSTGLQNITGIQFLLGVDSLKNVTGVQTGVLDPAMGMFWTWNTGYVMAKLDGSSPAAKTPAHALSFHVGGYKPGENTARLIQFSLPVVKHITHITLVADVLKWFTGIHDIKIASAAFCHEPGKLAVSLADNYKDMFSLEVL